MLKFVFFFFTVCIFTAYSNYVRFKWEIMSIYLTKYLAKKILEQNMQEPLLC